MNIRFLPSEHLGKNSAKVSTSAKGVPVRSLEIFFFQFNVLGRAEIVDRMKKVLRRAYLLQNVFAGPRLK